MAGGIIAGAARLMSLPALANGCISIKGDRIVYLQPVKQKGLSVTDYFKMDYFIIRSWVEDAFGRKTSDFVVAPPLYLSGLNNENTLRLMGLGGQLPQGRESLYYFITKTIPSIDNKKKAIKMPCAWPPPEK